MELNFWERVKIELKQRNIKQAVFAEECDIPVNTFVGWIAKNRTPDLEIIIKIADKLGVSVGYLISGNDDVNSHSEKELVSAYKNIPDVLKPAILNFLRELGDNFKKNGNEKHFAD